MKKKSWDVVPSSTGKKYSIVIDAKGQKICHIVGDEKSPLVRFIAASPDVAASLAELVKSPNAKRNAMWDRARAALLKAGVS